MKNINKHIKKVEQCFLEGSISIITFVIGHPHLLLVKSWKIRGTSFYLENVDIRQDSSSKFYE